MRETKRAIIHALRAWLDYAFAGEDAGRAHLQRALHIALTARRRGDANLKLLELAIFIAVEAGHFDTANELLDKAMNYRSFLKANEPKHYARLCYLYAYLEIRQGRVRSARKHWRNLLDASPTHTLDERVMLGRLHLAVGEHEDAYAQLAGAFAGGCRSPFVFEGLYRYFLTAQTAQVGAEFLPVLYYTAAHGGSIIALIPDNSDALSEAMEADPAMGERLYAVSSYHPLLKDICARRIRENDKSAEAFELYLSAERKQVFVPGLYAHLIQTAFENNAENITHYPMSQFLQTAEMDTDLAMYVYHLLLTDPKLADLLPAHTTKILQLAVRALTQGKSGRYANSLYYYYWKRCRAMGMEGVQTEMAEEIIREDLTLYELRADLDSQACFVYVTDAALRGMKTHEMPEEHVLVIEAAGADFVYTCLGAGQRSVLKENLTVRPMVGGADHVIFRHFFDKGDRRFFLLRYLADYYMTNPDLEAVQVLEAMLEQKSLIKAYRMELLLTLGQIYFVAEDYAKALEAYTAVDENTPGLPPRLLQIYMHTHNYQAAAGLIDRRHTQIHSVQLRQAFAQLLPLDDCRENLAAAAHYMLASGTAEEMYDQLLDVALEFFPFSQRELTALADAADIPTLALDRRILEGSLWMATIDDHAQAAFARLLKEPDCAHLHLPFVQLCTYHMLVTHFCPNYETLNALEKWYFSADPADNILGLALGQAYLKHNLTTLRSDRVIKDALRIQEENGLLLPAFKENKPAQIPFIEKHHPFLYKGLPGKEVYLYYRFTHDAHFRAKPMEYLRFGLYLACVPLFYNEEITYYFSEEMPTGSITTREATHKNTTSYLKEDLATDESDDAFFVINNAIILEQMFKHEQVENLIAGLVKDEQAVRAGVM